MILHLSIALILHSVGAYDFFIWVGPLWCAQARQIIPRLLRITNELQEKLQVHKRREKWFIVCIVILSIFFCGGKCNLVALGMEIGMGMTMSTRKGMGCICN